jgi:hypothetical protein
MLTNQDYQKIKDWIYRNGRMLDVARWKYHFEGGSKEVVLEALCAYQNQDGGFGHALEADSWNPNSSPIQTFAATEILKEIEFSQQDHPLIQGILKYLDSGSDFREGLWLNTILSNNDYPHAPWWYTGNDSTSNTDYNPTAGLSGFGLRYADSNSRLYKKCLKIAMQAIEKYIKGEFLNDMHTVLCYLRLMEYIESAGVLKPINITVLHKKLTKQIKMSITNDINSWKTNYICKPSQFFNTPDSAFYKDNKEMADFECQYIMNFRNPEGVWDIHWEWSDYPEEWGVSKNWWKGNLVIQNMLYLKNFGFLQTQQSEQ